ncbi:hypothetical protein [Bradyrhizobium sp.]|uniref:hypothetical protein n=1 Tax=Bradyrhizobium sp. TaxID=376 RepID=UPI003C2870CD
MSWSEATAYDISWDRKAITREAEKTVRRMSAAALRTTPPQRTKALPTPERPLPEPA